MKKFRRWAVDKLRAILCDRLDWHRPTQGMWFDDDDYGARCRDCGRRILVDSNGGWHRVARQGEEEQ